MATGPSPQIHIIAGPNGAGKTTFARTYLPRYSDCLHFLNADMIAQGLSPFAPELAAAKAGRLLLQQFQQFADQRLDFAVETTLAGRSYGPILRDLRQRGYRVFLYFLWLPDVQIALERVADRVRRGGHDVPEQDVRRRFHRGRINLFEIYLPLFDFWIAFDNSAQVPREIAWEQSGALSILDADAFRRFTEGVVPS